MNPAQSAFVVLAMLLGVAGFSFSTSAFAMPRIPRFRAARRNVRLLAGVSLGLCAVLLAWVLRA